MNKKLFLIGNGFDIAHGLNTRYLDLMIFMKDKDENMYKKFNALLLQNYLDERGYSLEADDDDKIRQTKEYNILEKDFNNPMSLYLYKLWESLEENMYYFFLDRTIDEVEMEKESLLDTLRNEGYAEVIKADLECIHRPAQENLDKFLKEFSDNFKEVLYEWVEKIDEEIDSKSKLQLLSQPNFFSENDLIINFNYSKTMEILYSKSAGDVCHIHGHGGSNGKNPPIMGHTKHFDGFGYGCIELKLVEDFYKDFDSIIAVHKNYLKKIKQATEVVVLGLSYGDTDYPYFEKISDLLPNGAKWSLYYHTPEDKTRAGQYVQKLNIKKVQHIPW